jgi:hypothetical protein
MLRLRTILTPGETLLVLEGRLAGPWVEELERSWARLHETKDAAPVRIDLDGVTFISATAKALLARLHDDGALLTARGCMTSATIEEIETHRPEITEQKK